MHEHTDNTEYFEEVDLYADDAAEEAWAWATADDDETPWAL